MKEFTMMEVKQSREYSMAGGQALHLWTPPAGGWPGAPAVFNRTAKTARQWGHLMDQDAKRLIATAKRLSVKRIKVSQSGRPHQHIDLCGGPLTRAIQECKVKGEKDD